MGRTLVASDNFNRTGPALGSDWLSLNAVADEMVIVSSTMVSGAHTHVDGASHRWAGTGTFSNDQYSSIAIVAPFSNWGGLYWLGVVCRAATGTDVTRSYYWLKVQADGANTTVFGKVVSGTSTTWATSTSFSWGAGDRIEIECEGTTIRAMRNGVALGGSFTQTDSSLTTGKPGLFGGGDPGTGTNGDNWEGGDVTATVTTLGTLTKTLDTLIPSIQGTVADPTAGGIVNVTLGSLTGTLTGTVAIKGIGKTSAITLAWDASSGATGYRIYVGTATGVYNYPTSPFSVGNVLIYRLENFPNNTYYFAITALNESGESGPSNEISDTITGIDGLYLSSLGLTLGASGIIGTGSIALILAQTLGSLTVTGTGKVSITGSLGKTLSALTLTATGATVAPGPPGIYAPAISSYSITAMPAAVYTAIADPDLRYYKVPRGRYTVSTDFAIQKPDFVLDWNGSTIFYTPDSTSLFNITSVIDAFVDATSPTRNASHLTGTITAATTTLTMDAAEIMDVAPGEIVTIVAGTNTSDPVEPHRYIVAEVLSVAGAVITFTAPLGENITVYASEAALEAVVDPSLWAKIGPWGDDYIGANYHKGLGTDHGLLRYVGGMNHDITVRNFHLDVTIPADASIPVSSGQSFFCRDILNLTIKNFSMMNVVMAPAHTWRCDNVLVENFKIRGVARSAIFSPGTTHVGYMMTAWGGTGITYRNGNVNARNIMFSNTEVSPADILFQNIRLISEAAGDWSSVSDAVLMGFHGNTLGSGVRVEDTSLKPTGYFTFDNGRPVTFENLVIDDTVSRGYFSFALHPIEGTFTINGDAYGPLAADTETIVLGAGNGQTVKPPKGLYKSARLRVTVPGGATAIGDQFGNSYTGAIASGLWTDVNQNWLRLQPDVPITSYDYQTTWVFNITGANVTVEFEIQYYPDPIPIGWVVS